jgi:hypothetical protein
MRVGGFFGEAQGSSSKRQNISLTKIGQTRSSDIDFSKNNLDSFEVHVHN